MDNRIPWEIVDLIVSRLNDSITVEESRQLDAWINASAHHKSLYGQWMAGKNFEAYEKSVKEHDYLPYFKVFCRRTASAKRKIWLKRISYAAAILLPLALFGIFFFPEKQTGLLAGNETIVPGEFRAVLTLPGGELVPLTQIAGEMQIKNGMAIVRQDTLAYEKRAGQAMAQFHKIAIPRGGEYILKLADGTRVWLNSETELRFPDAFQGEYRKVWLKGEAYFEVARDSLHPFVVETRQQLLTVLGTSFALRAYEDESHTLTTLESGKVKIQAEDKQVVLAPGYQAEYADGQIEVKKVNTSLYTAWHRGLFVFINQPLEEILNTLSRWYNIEVFYTNKELGKICFTGELQRYGEIRILLENIETLEKVRFQVKGRTVTVSEY